MKMKPLHAWAALALLLAGITPAPGQTQVPGPADYAGFSRFIAFRNIFDPTRLPRSTGYHPPYHPPSPRNHAAAFSFVGAMVYGKGMFAFFDGNNAAYRKALQVSGKIADIYTVKEITLSKVTLAETNGRTIDLPVGYQMQWSNRNYAWEQAGPGEGYSGQAESSTPTPASSSDGGSAVSSSPAGSSGTIAPAILNSPQSDVLKRLMQQRQQENK
jgi:hypothetical protein